MHEIGYGNLDFKAIVAAAEASGCEWFIARTRQAAPEDPFDFRQTQLRLHQGKLGPLSRLYGATGSRHRRKSAESDV